MIEFLLPFIIAAKVILNLFLVLAAKRAQIPFSSWLIAAIAAPCGSCDDVGSYVVCFSSPSKVNTADSELPWTECIFYCLEYWLR